MSDMVKIDLDAIEARAKECKAFVEDPYGGPSGGERSRAYLGALPGDVLALVAAYRERVEYLQLVTESRDFVARRRESESSRADESHQAMLRARAAADDHAERVRELEAEAERVRPLIERAEAYARLLAEPEQVSVDQDEREEHAGIAVLEVAAQLHRIELDARVTKNEERSARLRAERDRVSARIERLKPSEPPDGPPEASAPAEDANACTTCSAPIEFGDRQCATCQMAEAVRARPLDIIRQRDAAWRELRLIRERIGAQRDESTYDEVCRRVPAKSDVPTSEK